MRHSDIYVIISAFALAIFFIVILDVFLDEKNNECQEVAEQIYKGEIRCHYQLFNKCKCEFIRYYKNTTAYDVWDVERFYLK